MSRILTAFTLVLVCIGLSSCSFHWHITPRDVKKHDRIASDSTQHRLHTILPQPDYDTVATVAVPDSSAALKKLIGQLTPIWESHFTYKTFSGKAKIHFSGPDNDKTFTAHFRIRKDSVIWVNVTFDAIPVARLFITRDSFFLLNTIDQEVTRIPLSQAAKVLPTKVDFSSLQNLVTGESLQKGTITNAAASPDAWTIQVEDSNYIQHIVFNKKDSTMHSGQLRTRTPGGPQAVTSYESYEVINGRKVSTFRTLNVQKGADTYMLEMNFNKVGFDEELDYPFSIPKNYTEKK